MSKANVVAGSVAVLLLLCISVAAQEKHTYSGTIVSYGSGRNIRTQTAPFTLTITGTTSEDEVNRLVGILQEGGQSQLQEAIQNEDLGSFSIGHSLGRRLNAVRIETVDGKTRIRALFERWIHFGELRGGYRSLDYPFSYLEIFIDPKTGKGSGTLIEAAQVRWKRNKKLNDYVVEIENFATFPAKLMGVVERRSR